MKFGYDDSLDVFGVHGVGGLTGTLLADVFTVGVLSASSELPGGSTVCSKATRTGCWPRSMGFLWGVIVTGLWSAALTFIIIIEAVWRPCSCLLTSWLLTNF